MDSISESLSKSVRSGNLDADVAATFMVEMNKFEEIEVMRDSFNDRVEDCSVEENEFEIQVTTSDWYRPKYIRYDEYIKNPSWGYFAAMKEASKLFDAWSISDMDDRFNTVKRNSRSKTWRFMKSDTQLEIVDVVEEPAEWNYEAVKYVSFNEQKKDSFNQLLHKASRFDVSNEFLDYYLDDYCFITGKELGESNQIEEDLYEMMWKVEFSEYTKI